MNFQQQLDNLKNRHQFRQIPDLIHHGRYVEINGKHCLNLSGNDYLGLSYQQDLQKAFLVQYKNALPLFSSTSSRLLTGSSPHYRQLETTMAALFQQESCLLFNSGYHANIGILPALTDKQSLIIADKLVHASMIDGIRLAACDFIRFRHNDYQHLTDLLAENASRYHRIIIVTESVFSMDGDFADLHTLVALKKQYEHVLLYVDEAHAFGLYGQKGLGLAEELDCIADIDLLVGTFGKAAASIGAYLISSQEIRDVLINTMRPLIFSTALPPFNIAWTQFIVEKLPQLTARRQHLKDISHFLRNALVQQFNVDMPSQSCIVPYIIYDNDKALKLAQTLQQQGYYCLPIRPPTVPANTARIRFSLNADIQQHELEQLLDSLQALV
ncbi:MAG: 8-amino-7-oxononanoate synthase [Pelistega sp.]|nr:8-amino-7-oxononanoate synthase [Pelistega sp.]